VFIASLWKLITTKDERMWVAVKGGLVGMVAKLARQA
jgi:hypothetical protein